MYISKEYGKSYWNVRRAETGWKDRQREEEENKERCSKPQEWCWWEDQPC
jgi:hypothetical protein